MKTIDTETQKLKVDIQNQSGGIGRIQIKINGGEVTHYAQRGHDINENATNGKVEFYLFLPQIIRIEFI